MGEPTFWMKLRNMYYDFMRWLRCIRGEHNLVPATWVRNKKFCIWCEREFNWNDTTIRWRNGEK